MPLKPFQTVVIALFWALVLIVHVTRSSVIVTNMATRYAVVARWLLWMVPLKECLVDAAHLCSQFWVLDEELLNLRCVSDGLHYIVPRSLY